MRLALACRARGNVWIVFDAQADALACLTAEGHGCYQLCSGCRPRARGRRSHPEARGAGSQDAKQQIVAGRRDAQRPRRLHHRAKPRRAARVARNQQRGRAHGVVAAIHKQVAQGRRHRMRQPVARARAVQQ